MLIDADHRDSPRAAFAPSGRPPELLRRWRVAGLVLAIGLVPMLAGSTYLQLRSGGHARQSLDREKASLCCCVPHVIPVEISQELGKTWLRAIDAFVPRRWEDVMYAFGLAAVDLGLKIQITHLVNHNFWPDRKVTAPMIHYAYGDELWSKRNYYRDDQLNDLWNPRASARVETILGEILAQITEAREFYRDYFSFA